MWMYGDGASSGQLLQAGLWPHGDATYEAAPPPWHAREAPPPPQVRLGRCGALTQGGPPEYEPGGRGNPAARPRKRGELEPW